MVQSNKVTPAVQDLQGVNILGSWTLTDTAMVRLNTELKDRRLTIFLSFLEPRLSIGGTRKSLSTTITRKLQTPDPVKVRESPRKIKTLSNSSGNFSQLIWRASKTLGVGYGRVVSIFEVKFQCVKTGFWNGIKFSETQWVAGWWCWQSTTPRATLREALLQMCLLPAKTSPLADLKIMLWCLAW